ncbi:hypothetical protein FAS33_25200, partial [Salmonella enterica subsp. enterica serovar Newport]|nr:hypothetical protein [Salmonella enterica subsp. enterica serovar Newport]
MAWPFLSIILTRTYQLSPLAISSLMSGCALISVILVMVREKRLQKSSDTHNGYSSKMLLYDDGKTELNTPRDRENTVEPQL